MNERIWKVETERKNKKPSTKHPLGFEILTAGEWRTRSWKIIFHVNWAASTVHTTFVYAFVGFFFCISVKCDTPQARIQHLINYKLAKQIVQFPNPPKSNEYGKNLFIGASKAEQPIYPCTHMDKIGQMQLWGIARAHRECRTSLSVSRLVFRACCNAACCTGQCVCCGGVCCCTQNRIRNLNTWILHPTGDRKSAANRLHTYKRRKRYQNHIH